MFLDGAMGTMVQLLKLQESDFRGKHIQSKVRSPYSSKI